MLTILCKSGNAKNDFKIESSNKRLEKIAKNGWFFVILTVMSPYKIIHGHNLTSKEYYIYIVFRFYYCPSFLLLNCKNFERV